MRTLKRSVDPFRLNIEHRLRYVLLWFPVDRLDLVRLHTDPHGPMNIDPARLLVRNLSRTAHVDSE